MRVGIVAHAARVGDAIGRQIAAKASWLRERGAAVHVIVATDRELEPSLRPLTSRFSPQQLEIALAHLKSSDLVFLEFSQDSPVWALVPPLAAGRARILFDYHGVTPPELGAAGHRDALVRGQEQRHLVWFADAAIVHSRFTLEELHAATGYPRDRIHPIGYPVDFAAPECGRETTAQANSSNSKTMLFVGRLAPNKRASILVQALEFLPRDVHAVLVGDAGDAYAGERQRCREWAARLGVADRVHFLGRVDDERLRAAYAQADVLVIPSVHEGFCFPAVEAMRAGVPVVAARATALPETLGPGGLTFEPDDPRDLARQVRRVLCSHTSDAHVSKPRRVAIVSERFGDGFAGGVERSLRLLAHRMRDAGYTVEIFTLGDRDERSSIDGLTVHRFRADRGDAERRAAAAHAIALARGGVDEETEFRFIESLPHAPALVGAVAQEEFDAIVAGPYLSRMTLEIARVCRERTLLVPCWHDEPTARLRIWRAYRDVGGVFHHSDDEQSFAERVLGMNHPNSRVIGTVVDLRSAGDARVGRDLVGGGRRYLLFAGRLCPDKGVERLFGFMERYGSEHPERFTLALIGGGDGVVPDRPWIRNLGYVTEDARRDVMAGAAAVVNLSRCESLSLVVLEAHALGVPAIVSAECPAMVRHVERGAGGVAVGDFESFAAALDDLWVDPEHWRERGAAGRRYVEECFGDAAAFDQRWREVVAGLSRSVAENLRLAGPRRAAEFSVGAWRKQLASVCVRTECRSPRPRDLRVILRPVERALRFSMSEGTTCLRVRVCVEGSLPILAEGPHRWELVSQVFDADGRERERPLATPLPGPVAPGQSRPALVRVRVPDAPGDYLVMVGVRPPGGRPADGWIQTSMTVAAGPRSTGSTVLSDALRVRLASALSAQQLPDGYEDVTLGRFARVKRWIKRKLLHNFQVGYVDVLSRQQSAFNRQVLAALADLCEQQEYLAAAFGSPSAPFVNSVDRVMEPQMSSDENGSPSRRPVREAA